MSRLGSLLPPLPETEAPVLPCPACGSLTAAGWFAAKWHPQQCEDCERAGRDRAAEMSLIERLRRGGLTERQLRAIATLVPSAGQCAVRDWKPRGCLLICGPSGTGKTLAACFLARQRATADKPFVMANVPEMLDGIRRSYDADGPGDGPRTLDRIRRNPLAILDDLGAERSTEWVREQLYTVVNHRYEHELPVVIVTNLGMDDFSEALGSRIASRLVEMTRADQGRVVELRDRDWRLTPTSIRKPTPLSRAAGGRAWRPR